MRILSIAVSASLLAQPLFITPSFATVATGNMNVKITIEAACKVQSAADLNFGTQGVLDADVDQTSEIGVQCTNGTPYSVALNKGNGAGATIAARRMTGPGSATLDYTIYLDEDRLQLWGDTTNTTVDGTGDGTEQTLTAYGRVPAQSTPAPGAYSDIVTVTVTY